MVKKNSIIVVDDHSIFREGIKSLIKLKDNAEVIAEASNGKEFQDLISEIFDELAISRVCEGKLYYPDEILLKR